MSSKKQSDQASDMLERELTKFEVEMRRAIGQIQNITVQLNTRRTLLHQLETSRRHKDPLEEALDYKLAELNLIVNRYIIDKKKGSF